MRRLLLCLAVLALAACADPGSTPGGAPAPAPSSGLSDTGRSPSVTPEPTPTGTGSGQVVTLTGQVVAGVESGCVLLDGWLLLGGDADVLRPGARVRVEGVPAQGVATTCQEGRPLQVTRATPVY